MNSAGTDGLTIIGKGDGTGEGINEAGTGAGAGTEKGFGVVT